MTRDNNASNQQMDMNQPSSASDDPNDMDTLDNEDLQQDFNDQE